MRTNAPGCKYRTRDKDGLTRAYRAVLETLKRAANDQGTAILTNGELAAKAGVSRRSVQAATSHLAGLGLILKIERRRTRDYSDPNVYRLAGRKKFSPQGRKNRTQLTHRVESNLHTSSLTSSAADASCNLALREAERKPEARRPLPRARAPKTPALTRHDREKLTTGLRRLGIDLGNDLALTDGQLLDWITELRRDRIPGFNERSWGFRATVHGVQAWFGVIETVGMLDGLIPQKDGGIRNAAAYLGGILWKDETDPRKTVLDWLDIEARKEREAESAHARQVYAARQSVNDELLAQAIEIMAEELPPEEIASWVGPAWIVAVTDESVVIAYPTRFLKEYAWTNYRLPIQRALAKARGVATSVRLVVRTSDMKRKMDS